MVQEAQQVLRYVPHCSTYIALLSTYLPSQYYSSRALAVSPPPPCGPSVTCHWGAAQDPTHSACTTAESHLLSPCPLARVRAPRQGPGCYAGPANGMAGSTPPVWCLQRATASRKCWITELVFCDEHGDSPNSGRSGVNALLGMLCCKYHSTRWLAVK